MKYFAPSPINKSSTGDQIREIPTESFDLEDSEDLIGLARTLVDGRHLGILATVDGDGKPACRWMSTLSFSNFPWFYALTHPASRKVKEIREHPSVNWMFFNQDLTLIMNLHGTARIHDEAPVLKRVWDEVVDKEHAYFLKQYATGAGFVAIQTHVERIECTSPQNVLRLNLEPSDLARA